ncbi:uncharacterized protein KY384_005959 [Bacidia gigantensis]|uniref:uncharacterized protein n=1 Tax=Bacidia gigantensis TaxID=2732470 RepID=UPI001D04CEA5|nr:uncharacterized protein KY384_005959 [Bacidia gigantensis]KAG8529323.1 hypothetical protein KY384_005959 [Bacidia gigantensis]
MSTSRALSSDAPKAAETDAQAEAVANTSGVTAESLQKSLEERLQAQHVQIEDMSVREENDNCKAPAGEFNTENGDSGNPCVDSETLLDPKRTWCFISNDPKLVGIGNPTKALIYGPLHNGTNHKSKVAELTIWADM